MEEKIELKIEPKMGYEIRIDASGIPWTELKTFLEERALAKWIEELPW